MIFGPIILIHFLGSKGAWTRYFFFNDLNKERNDAFGQELRLDGEVGSKWRWTAGVNAYDEHARQTSGIHLSPQALASHLEEIDTRFMAEAKEAATARQKAQSAAAAPASPAMTVEPIAERPAGTGKPLRTTGAVDARSQQAEKAAAQDKSAAQNLFAAKQVDKPPARKVFAIVVGTITVLAICGIGGYFWWQLQPKTSLVASRTPSPPPAMPVPPAAPPVAVPPAPTLGETPPRTTAAIRHARRPASIHPGVR